MKGCAIRKDVLIEKILKSIGKVYLPESGVYKNVKKGLQKLSRVELSGLSVMITTSQ